LRSNTVAWDFWSLSDDYVQPRARMVRHMETIPGFDRLAAMPPYPGKTFNGVIRRAQSRRRPAGK